MYTCSYCEKNYRYKKNLVGHETVCKFMQLPLQSRNEIIDIADDELPTLRDLYYIIQQQSLRIDQLESNQKKIKHMQRRKINLLHWLQQKKDPPTTTFPVWIATLLARVPTYIEIVFKENLWIAMTQLFASLEDADHLPICVFDYKPSQYYVYRLHTWEELPLYEFDSILQKIADQFYTVFVNGWYTENKGQLMKNDALYDQFIRYQQKILKPIDYANLRKFIYSRIKRVVETITEYEVA